MTSMKNSNDWFHTSEAMRIETGKRLRISHLICVCLAMLIGIAAPVLRAQTDTGAIHGVVTDTAGLSVPNAKITIESPALIASQSKNSGTDGTYRFEQLPPGVYSVRYVATGFQQVLRENITITPGFYAEVKVELPVGAATETVTVTAAGPTIDTTSTQISTQLSSNVMSNEMPVTREGQEVLRMMPGVQMNAPVDTAGGLIANGSAGIVYGQVGQPNDFTEGVDNRYFETSIGDTLDFPALESFTVVTVGNTADVMLPGVYFNGVYKTGGNQYHGRLEVNGETDKLEGNNLNAALRAAPTSATTPQTVLNSIDATANGGGPIIRNKWWFYAGAHVNSTNKSAIGFIDPATGAQLPTYTRTTNNEAKTTFQLSPNYKLVGFWGMYTQYIPFRNGNSITPPLASVIYTWPIWNLKGEFVGNPKPNMVFDAFVARHHYQANYTAQADPQNIPTITDGGQHTTGGTGIAAGQANGPSLGQDHRPRDHWQITTMFSWFPNGSYFGHHEFKVGETYKIMSQGTQEPVGVHGNYKLSFDNAGAYPYQISMYNYPITSDKTRLNEGGFYLMDNWKMAKRVTISLGVRFDQIHAFDPPQSKPATEFGPPFSTTAPFVGVAQSYPYINAGQWFSPALRIGAVFDVFGTGKSVLKVSYGKYHYTPGDDYGVTFNQNAPQYATYRWHPPTLPGGGICTFAIASQPNGGGCDYVPGQVNLDPNNPVSAGGDFISLSAANNSNPTNFPNSIYNPNLFLQYQHQAHIGWEQQLSSALTARAAFTYVQDVGAWQQLQNQQPYSAFDIPHTYYVNPDPTAAVSTTSTVGTPITVYDIDPANTGIAHLAAETQNTPNNFQSHFQTIETTLIGHPAGARWNLLVAFATTKDHRWIIPITSSTTFSAGTGAPGSFYPTNPDFAYNALDTTWNWSGQVSGNYNLPRKFSGIDIALAFSILNGLNGVRTNNYTLPNFGTMPVLVGPYGAVHGPIRDFTSMRFSRNFKFKSDAHGTLRPTVELLNLTNTAGQWAIGFASGPSYGKITTTDTPFLVRGGLVYTF
jgi:hypothetical protein